MTGELFLASVLFAAGCSVTVYLLLSARMNRRAEGTGAADDFDLTPIETRLADLVSDMNRVANSHTQAIADRRDELKRVIEMANERIRRLNTILADMAILEQRLRDPRRVAAEPQVDEEPRMPPRARSEGSTISSPKSPETGQAGDRPAVAPTNTVVEDGVGGSSWPSMSAAGGRRRAKLPVERVVPSDGGAWVFEVPGPVDGQERARDIESLAADGLSPAAIASRLRLPIHAVEQVLGGRGRH